MEPTEIVLTIPGKPEFLRLARMAAADAASRVGLTYEEIDDLRIAVDELCFAIMGEDGSGAPLTLVYQIHPGAVSVSGSCPGDDVGPVLRRPDPTGVVGTGHRRMLPKQLVLGVGERSAAGQEAHAFWRFDAEATAPPRHDVDHQLRVFPRIELRSGDPDGHSAVTDVEDCEQDVTVADDELAVRVAHRR